MKNNNNWQIKKIYSYKGCIKVAVAYIEIIFTMGQFATIIEIV